MGFVLFIFVRFFCFLCSHLWPYLVNFISSVKKLSDLVSTFVNQWFLIKREISEEDLIWRDVFLSVRRTMTSCWDRTYARPIPSANCSPTASLLYPRRCSFYSLLIGTLIAVHTVRTVMRFCVLRIFQGPSTRTVFEAYWHPFNVMWQFSSAEVFFLYFFTTYKVFYSNRRVSVSVYSFWSFIIFLKF